MSSKNERKRQAIAEAKAELKSLAKTCESFQLECREIPVVFTLKVFPQDEDFPFDVDHLFLQFTLGWKYPFEPLEIELLNRDDFPESLCEHIDDELTHQAASRAGSAAVFSLLRWIDENFETLMYVVGEGGDGADDNAGRSMSLADIQAAIDAVDVSAPGAMEQLQQLYALNKEAEENGGHTMVPGHDNGEDAGGGSAEVDTSHLEGITVHGVPEEVNEQVKHALAQVGIDVLVEGAVRLEGVGILDCTKLVLEVVCDRCAEHCTMPLQPLRPVRTKCAKCTKQLVAVYAPATMHEHSRLLGTIAVDGCAPLEVLPSEYVASCLTCDGKVMLSGAALGRFHDRNCFSCNAKVVVRMERAAFEHKKPSEEALRAARKQARGAAAGGAQGRRVQEEKLGFRPGDELPKRGACKHYRHSYRWLRFPCCGRCFPCDECHNANSNHFAVWANKMVCGFCSMEQSFSQGKPCRACGKRLAGKNTANKATMSKKDARKHRGKNKTISRKAARQGRIPHH